MRRAHRVAERAASLPANLPYSKRIASPLTRGLGLARAVLLGSMLLLAQPCLAEQESAANTQTLRSLFSPWDDIEGAIIEVIAKAQREVLVQAYLLTSRPITKALVAARQRGVVVQVLADGEMAQRAGGEQLDVLAQAGLPVWLETRYAAAHNKVIVADVAGANPVLITGSYNFTWSAQARNAENVLIVSGNRELARRYAENWRRHRAEATPYRQPAVTEH